VIDEMKQYLWAGTETTALTLAWSLYLLSMHPEALERIRAEARAVCGDRDPVWNEVQQLSYTRMVIQETMRLFPPIWALIRIAAGDDEIEGHKIKAGDKVVILTYIAHHSPKYWDEPEKFDPERFAPERAKKRVKYSYLPFAAGKAHIAVTEVRRDGSWSPPVPVLQRDYHLSYPFLLEHEGQLYMIPETGQNGTVELYRCVDFPLRWKLEKTLLQGVRLVDATLHRGADRWWMFANGAAGASRGFDDELHLFHADSLFGEWHAHPRNPVKSDVRCARPAGNLYWRDGKLYRPAQICVPRYGAGLSINRVLRLTPHSYAERQVERVLPDAAQGLLGLHTINRAGDLTVADAFTRRRRIGGAP